jgi:VWFA-related protein
MIGLTKRSGARGLLALLGIPLLTVAMALAQLPDSNLPKVDPNDLPPAQPGQPAPANRTENPPNTNTPPSPSQPNDPAATAPAIQPDDHPISITTRSVLLPTTVKDKATGDFINGLTVSNFKVFDNGHEQRISSDFTLEPLSVVAVIQANSDVEPMIPKLKRAGLLMQGLVSGEGGDISVISFDHKIKMLQDWTNDPDRLNDAMQKLTAGSSTARTIDAVVQADQMLRRHDPQGRRRRVIVLFSEGYDKGSEARSDETVRQMQFDNVVVYAIDISQLASLLSKTPDGYRRPVMGGVPPEAIHSPTGNTMSATEVLQNHPGGNVLNIAPPVWRSIKDLFKLPPDQAFTRMTGGRVYSFAKQNTLEQAITDLGKELHSQYVLSYQLGEATRVEPGFHHVQVVVDHPGLDVRTRLGYYWGGGAQ